MTISQGHLGGLFAQPTSAGQTVHSTLSTARSETLLEIDSRLHDGGNQKVDVHSKLCPNREQSLETPKQGIPEAPKGIC